MNGILEILPEYALYGFYAVVAGVAFLIALSFWKNIAPAAPGVILGYYEILGRYGGGSLMKRIQGTLVDSTHIFLNPEIEPKFKRYIIRNLDALSKKNPGSPSELRSLRSQLIKYPLRKVCRIVVTRDRFWTKHVLVQWGYVDKPISEYAMHEERGKFTLSSGLITRGIITGALKTLPEPWEVPNLGKCRVHLFLPDAKRGEHFTAPPVFLAKIALYTPSVVEMNELLESKDEIIRDLRRLVAEVGEEVSRASTRRDAAVKALKGLSMEKAGEIEALGERRMSIEDLILIGGPAGAGAYIANYLGYEWLYGALAGLIAGYFLYRRRRR